jgi:hypothetical protein
MGKSRQRHNRSSSTGSGESTPAKSKGSASSTHGSTSAPSSQTSQTSRRSTLYQWLASERQSLTWVFGCAIIGAILGFGIGTGHLTGAYSQPVTPWRKELGKFVRATATYKVLTLRAKPWNPVMYLWHTSMSYVHGRKNLMGDPSNPIVFNILREAITREKGGYVHPDLGMMIPAPSRAARGLGMVRDGYNKCQTHCVPGVASEKREPVHNRTSFKQEEVLIRIPLSYQMTRTVALDTLLPLIPADGHRKDPLQELDDAALLVLLLAHERGLSRASRWLPYIASLPTEPSCGYSSKLRPYMLDAVAAYGGELGVDVSGWPRELAKAGKYAEKIASGLSGDYGNYIRSPPGVSVYNSLQWALCQVASRATAGSEKHGSLRLVPLMDLINHDASAGGFVELTGKERLENGDFVNTTEEDSGTFVVRSLRHGRRKPLKKGQVRYGASVVFRFLLNSLTHINYPLSF